MSTQTRLQEIGEGLERVFAADLRAEAGAAPASTGSARRRARLVTRRARWLAAAATVIAVPGVAYPAGVLTSPQSVAHSLPAGAKMLVGSDPTCTVVKANVDITAPSASRPPPTRFASPRTSRCRS